MSDCLFYADIVFCIDASGSMERFLYNFREALPNLENTVKKGFEENERDFGNARVRFVLFRDFGCDKEPLVESEFFTLPEDADAMMAFLEYVEPIGGGDQPESALEALTLAVKSEWRTGRDVRQTVVLFTDADAHPLGEHAWLPHYPEDMPASSDELRAFWNQGGENGCLKARGRVVAVTPAGSELFSELCEWDKSIVVDEDPSTMTAEGVAKLLATICNFISG